MTFAWIVSDEESDTIVFAPTKIEALKKGAFYFLGEPESIAANRKPEYDPWVAQGYVPAKRLWEDGWYFDCVYCGLHVDSDGGYQEETDTYTDPAFTEHSSFCCTDCLESQTKIWERNKKIRLEEQDSPKI